MLEVGEIEMVLDKKRAMIIGGVLAAAGVVGIAYLLFRRKQKPKVRKYVEPELDFTRENIIEIMTKIREITRAEVEKSIIENRRKRRQVDPKSDEYAALVHQLKNKLEKSLSNATKDILSEFKLEQRKFDEAFEYYNDSDLMRYQSELKVIDDSNARILDKDTLITSVKAHSQALNEINLAKEVVRLDSDVISAMLEDRLFEQQNVELEDMMAGLKRFRGQELKRQVEDFASNSSSQDSLSKMILSYVSEDS